MSTVTRPLPTTIDGVVARLQEIVDQSFAGSSRLGFFAALYKRVTVTVRALLGKGYFDDDARMERLDVVFANRYLAALDDYTRGGPRCTAPWKVAFDEVANEKLIILQHLVLGMNAHIELDLGVAVAEVAPGDALPGIREDFDKINTLLAALSPLVEEEIGRLSPMIRFAETVGKRAERAIVDTGMLVARSTAWRVAESMASLDPEARARRIAERAEQVAGWGRFVAKPPLLLRAGLRVIRWRESDDVRAIIRTLDTAESIRFEGSPIMT